MRGLKASPFLFSSSSTFTPLITSVCRPENWQQTASSVLILILILRRRASLILCSSAASPFLLAQ